MTDEEYGRAWARRMKVAPYCGVPGDEGYGTYFGWLSDRVPGHPPSPYPDTPELSACRVPGPVMDAMQANGGFIYPTDSSAYAALGAAVRRVHELVPRVEERAHGQ